MLRHAKDGGQGTACQSLSCPKQITTDGQGKTVAAAKEVATNCDGEKVAFAPKEKIPFRFAEDLIRSRSEYGGVQS